MIIMILFSVFKADELETKLEEIKLEINNLYKKTSSKSEGPNVNKNGDELTDHDYIDNIECIESVPVIKADKLKENKKKTKKVCSFEEVKLKVSFIYPINFFLISNIF